MARAEGGLDAAAALNNDLEQRSGITLHHRIDDALDAELCDFIARRKSEMPDEIG